MLLNGLFRPSGSGWIHDGDLPMNPLVLLAMLLLVFGMVFRLLMVGIGSLFRLLWQGCWWVGATGMHWFARKRDLPPVEAGVAGVKLAR